MKTLIDAIKYWLSRLLSRDLVRNVLDGIERAAPYLDTAYELVQTAARLAPNRTVAELASVADALGVPAVWRSDDKGAAIRELVLAALRWRFPQVPDRVLNRAIELAYGALRP
ncbi:MAG: hypothetical protein KatS3mg004_1863 [Bryobacteraceae bacterium]|nr:MAG: hypothetical protein KatS3mg004_1863 [Bryobacteraceae bacterium]